MRPPRERLDPDEKPEGLTHNPFAALRPGGAAPTQPDQAALGKEANSVPGDQDGEGGARIVVRRESKGRAGKTVTRLSGLPQGSLEDLARKLRKALGCGASVEGEDVLLQGAQGERAADFLQQELPGARVSLGN